MAEFFISDIHGEYEPFSHVLRNACGAVRQAIDAEFGETLNAEDKALLATLVYYPQRKMQLLADEGASAEELDELAAQARRLCQAVAGRDVQGDAAAEMVSAASAAIRETLVSHVHMLGDVYDRGPSPDLIMDELMALPSVDVQWGNHDILWMGAAAGQRGSVANAVRICARYSYLSVLEDNYGIDLGVLRDFAQKAYGDDPCVGFAPKSSGAMSQEEIAQIAKVQKAISFIQFKVEAQTIRENGFTELEDRNLLGAVDFERGTVVVDGVEHELIDKLMPTVNPQDPFALTDEEEQVIASLVDAFVGCERLQRHIRFFIDKGSLYLISGNNLLLHACVPLNADGSLMESTIYGQTLKGRALFDAVDGYVRDAFFATDEVERKRGLDLLWYLWLAPASPLFAKSKMATFELYLVADKAARKEVKNPYYTLNEDPAAVMGILEDFGMDPQSSRILSGHVPVKVKDGEDPVKCGGKVLVIDGGFSHAYQPTTGIAGLTVVQDEGGSVLMVHPPLPPVAEVIAQNLDMYSEARPL